MHTTKSRARLRFKVEAFEPLAGELGLRTDADKANFLGVDPSTYSRVVRAVTEPSQQFVASAMSAFSDNPDVTFETLFDVEDA